MLITCDPAAFNADSGTGGNLGLCEFVLAFQQDVFQVTGLQMFNLSKAAAAEFLEVYKGVVAPGEFRCVAAHTGMRGAMTLMPASQAARENIRTQH